MKFLLKDQGSTSDDSNNSSKIDFEDHIISLSMMTYQGLCTKISQNK